MQHLAQLARHLVNVPIAMRAQEAEVLFAAIADGVARFPLGAPEMYWDGDDDGYYFGPRGADADPGYDMVGPVAHICIRGTLIQRFPLLRPYWGITGYNGLRQAFLTALADPAVEAIVFDIDSGGGEVAGCFDLVDLIYASRGTKPIGAILSENAFSAAYALASAVDPGRLWVPRTGGTGSIGVICGHVDLSKALEGIGIKYTFIYYGAKKADGHPEIPLSDEARSDLQADIDTMGELFVETVARNRGLTTAAIRETQAATYLGASGVKLGLADAVKAPNDAFRELRAELG